MRALAAPLLAAIAVLTLTCGACTSSEPRPAYDAGAGPGPGVCPAECGDTLCTSTSTPASVACRACLERAVAKGGPCEVPVVAACQPDQDCMQEQQCVAFCQGNVDGGADVACVSAGDLQACANCCATRHKTGYDTFFSALVACGCGR